MLALLVNFAALDGSTGTPQSGTPQNPIVVTGTVAAGAPAPVLATPAGYYVNGHTLQNQPGEIR